jgi:hypothetical protein
LANGGRDIVEDEAVVEQNKIYVRLTVAAVLFRMRHWDPLGTSYCAWCNQELCYEIDTVCEKRFSSAFPPGLIFCIRSYHVKYREKQIHRGYLDRENLVYANFEEVPE